MLMNDKILFNAVLRPNRSLAKKGFLWVMVIASLLCLTVGLMFLLAGAWPVTGFLGLELLLLHIALLMSYRSGHLTETIQLRKASLSVFRFVRNGSSFVWHFQPYWLQVEFNREAHHDSQIILRSKGKSVSVGSFLSPNERADFAHALMKALRNCKNGQSVEV